MAGTGSLRLTQSEAREILSARLEGILVGGLALAMWAHFYDVEPPTALQAGVTSDLDFLGTRFDARQSFERLVLAIDAAVGFREATISDSTANSARIWVHGFHDRRDPIGIDYLIGLAGYSREDENKLKTHAVEATVGEIRLRLMHPVDCLISRVRNVHVLPEKRGPASIAQCRLAVEVVKAYLSAVCRDSAQAQRSEGLKALERVVALAQSDAGIHLTTEFGIDLLNAIPADEFSSPQFHEYRWPQIQKAVAEGIARRKRQRERRRGLAKNA